jgi:hypothetical protein
MIQRQKDRRIEGWKDGRAKSEIRVDHALV